jgi:hypothetical protein
MERVSVLNSFKAIGSAQVKARRAKAKGEIYKSARSCLAEMAATHRMMWQITTTVARLG